MIYKGFAAATLLIALLVALMADGLTPGQRHAGAQADAVSAPQAAAAPETAPIIRPQEGAPPMEESAPPPDSVSPGPDSASPGPDSASPGDVSAFGQPMAGAGAPLLAPGRGLPEAPASPSAEGVDPTADQSPGPAG